MAREQERVGNEMRNDGRECGIAKEEEERARVERLLNVRRKLPLLPLPLHRHSPSMMFSAPSCPSDTRLPFGWTSAAPHTRHGGERKSSSRGCGA